MKKKTHLLLCAGLCGTLLLSGCQSESSDDDTKTETTTASQSNQSNNNNNNNDKEEDELDAKKLAESVTKMPAYKQTSMYGGVSVHDPSIFKDKDGTYYVYGSHLAQASSPDLMKWTAMGVQGYGNTTVYGPLATGLAESFKWAGMNDQDCKNGYAVWAPDITYNERYVWPDGTKGAYMMYYCTSSTYMRSCIGFGVSKSVKGPFEYVDTLVYSGFTSNTNKITTTSNMGTKVVDTHFVNTNVDEIYKAATGKASITAADLPSNYFKNGNFNNNMYPNAIDPAILYDTEGKMWMSYGSWSGGIYILELDPATGKAIHPKENSTNGNAITDIYFGKKIAGGYSHSGEGPYIIYNDETKYYYLYMSYGYLTAKEGYNIRMFRSENPDGPYVDAAGKEATWNASGHDGVGVKVMGSHKLPVLHYDYMAPGHNSALVDDDGKMYLFYHQRFSSGNEWHELRVHQMGMSEDGWPCVLPYVYDGEEITADGLSKDSVAGTYFLLKQDPTDNKAATNYNAVKLNEDGTLSGFLTGTWEYKEDTNYLTITVGVKKYNGIVCKMKDEAGTDCTVFSLVGETNSTLWGTKY